MGKLTRVEVRRLLVELLGEYTDPVLTEHGFRRSAKGMVYRRRHGESHQTIDIICNRPRFSDDPSDAHLIPMVRVEIPRLSELANELAGEPSLLQGLDRFVYFLPAGILGPERNMVDWCPSGELFFHTAIKQMTTYLLTWVVPFLDRFESPSGVVRTYEDGSLAPSMAQGYGWRVVLAAAYLLAGKPQRARCVVGAVHRSDGDPLAAALRARTRVCRAGVRRHRAPRRRFRLGTASTACYFDN